MGTARLYIVIALAALGAASVSAQSIRHRVFMRGSIVDTNSVGPVLCIGRSDGARPGQVLDVYRIVFHPSIPGKAATPTYHRKLIGQLRINQVLDDHFAQATITRGRPETHDIVELRHR